MQKTPNYYLNLYEPSDSFLHTDFNANNQTLDNVLKTIADSRPFVTGNYVGNGTYTGSTATTRYITLGFRPKSLLIFSPKVERDSGTYSNSASRFALLVEGYSIVSSSVTMAVLTETGFAVSHYADSTDCYSPALNMNGILYFYLAFF